MGFTTMHSFRRPLKALKCVPQGWDGSLDGSWLSAWLDLECLWGTLLVGVFEVGRLTLKAESNFRWQFRWKVVEKGSFALACVPSPLLTASSTPLLPLLLLPLLLSEPSLFAVPTRTKDKLLTRNPSGLHHQIRIAETFSLEDCTLWTTQTISCKAMQQTSV